jgi:hypothetical protein
MTGPKDSGPPLDRIFAAIDEWLSAFDAESSELVRAELAQIAADDPPEVILARIEKALQLLEDDATRLYERSEEERRRAEAAEQTALERIRNNDDAAAKDALARVDNHLAQATQLFDDAVQLKWLLNQYRSAAAAMGKGPVHTDDDDDDEDDSETRA